MRWTREPAPEMPATVAALVRPAPAEWRRSVSLLGVAALVWVAANSFQPVTGANGNGGGMSWEAGRPVELRFDVTNTGLLPVDVVGAVAPPGVRRVTVAGGHTQLGSYSGGAIRFRAEIGDCRKLDPYLTTMTLKVRTSPVGWTRDVTVDVPFTAPPAEVDGVTGGPDTGWLAQAIEANCPRS